MIKKVLLTGASGLIGLNLHKALLEKGYLVHVLSTRKSELPNYFYWNVYRQEIDPMCMQGVDAIIHLAGEAIVDKKWTEERKKQIIYSRTESTNLLCRTIASSQNHNIQSFICASAVGYYGNRADECLTEESSNGTGFLAECCYLWEKSVEPIENLGIRAVKLRTGIVLSKQGGALSSFEKPIKYFVGCTIGNGKQWTPWIHLKDMVNLYLYALENNAVNGTYNACAPFPITNENLMKAIAKKINRPLWPLHVPEKVIELLMGTRSEAVLMSSNTSAQKTINTKFSFQYPHIETALNDLYQ